MPPYRYFSLAPQRESDALCLEHALASIQLAFPEYEIDAAAALASAKHRRECLVALNAPRAVLDIYENPKVTRIRITEDSCDGAYLEFDLWDRQGIDAYPRPDETCFEVCQMLATKLAGVLRYEIVVQEYD